MHISIAAYTPASTGESYRSHGTSCV